MQQNAEEMKEQQFEEEEDSDLENEENASAEEKEAETTEERYPELFNFIKLTKQPVRASGVREEDEAVIFDLDKSERGRYCECVGRTHRQNNGCLVFFKATKKLYRKCRKHDCQHFSKLLWTQTTSTAAGLLEKDEEDEQYFIRNTEDNLCREFKAFLGNECMCKFEDGDTVFYFYNGLYWKQDKDCTRLRLMLGNEFKFHLINKLNTFLKAGKIEEQAFIKGKRHITDTLERHARKTAIIKNLAHHLRNDQPTNAHPEYLVFQNGAWNVATNEFGPTKPEQYITDAQICPHKWRPREEVEVKSWNSKRY